MVIGYEFVLNIAVTLMATLLASSGFWAYMQSKDKNKDATARMLLGLGHDRIVFLGLKYIERGWITQDEYENLYEYLYVPYLDLGGNGSAKKIMNDVGNLPIKNKIAIMQGEKNEKY